MEERTAIEDPCDSPDGIGHVRNGHDRQDVAGDAAAAERHQHPQADRIAVAVEHHVRDRPSRRAIEIDEGERAFRVAPFQLGGAQVDLIFVGIEKSKIEGRWDDLRPEDRWMLSRTESLKKEFSRRDKDLVALQADIKKIEEKLQRDGAILSDSETQRLERDLVAKQRKLKTAQNEFQEELSLRQNEELNKLRRQIAEVIIEVAKEDSLDLVLETGVVYASERANVTEKVLERLKAKGK